MAQERTSISIDSALLKRLRKLSRDSGEPVSNIIERCVLGGIGEVELVNAARRDPLAQAFMAELFKPENVSRAAKIVGETAENPDLFRRRAAVLAELAKKAGKP